MKKIRLLIAGCLCCILTTLPILEANAAPAMATPSGLGLLELKVTGDEYIMLQNNTSATIPDLSVYWLNAFNNVSPLAAGVSSSSQQLPAASLAPRQTLLLSASPMSTCGSSVAGKLSVSLTDTGGFLQLTRFMVGTDGALSQVGGDYVSWSSGANGSITNLPSSTKSPRAAYYRYSNGNSFAWQLADLDTSDSCQLNIVVAGGSGSSSAVTPLTLAATSPPVTILGSSGTTNENPGPRLPVADIGLASPQLSELLPNPLGTGNDKTEEFIELYNPNEKVFDLSGFMVDTGMTTIHTYTFPEGTTIEPKSFKAFFAKDTKISLSNTASIVTLLDPFGAKLSEASAYKSAKDGISWVNANNKWQWSTQPTPNAANIIKAPLTKEKKTTGKKSSKKRSLADETAVGSSSLNSGLGSLSDKASGGVVHTWVLALIAGVALLYGAYEYRRDLANRLFQLKPKLSFSGRTRSKPAGGRSD